MAKNPRIIECEICDQAFESQSELDDHMLTSHPEESMGPDADSSLEENLDSMRKSPGSMRKSHAPDSRKRAAS